VKPSKSFKRGFLELIDHILLKYHIEKYDLMAHSTGNVFFCKFLCALWSESEIIAKLELAPWFSASSQISGDW